MADSASNNSNRTKRRREDDDDDDNVGSLHRDDNDDSVGVDERPKAIRSALQDKKGGYWQKPTKKRDSIKPKHLFEFDDNVSLLASPKDVSPVARKAEPKIQNVDDETLYEDSTNYIGRNVCVCWDNRDRITEHYFGTITSKRKEGDGTSMYTAFFPDLGVGGEEEDIDFLTVWKYINNYNIFKEDDKKPAAKESSTAKTKPTTKKKTTKKKTTKKKKSNCFER